MTIVAQDNFNRTENPITGWTKINTYGDGYMTADAGRAAVFKGASTPPLMRFDATAALEGSRKVSMPLTTFSRANIFPVITDEDNYIMVYTSGTSLSCVPVIDGVQGDTVSIPGITINQADTISIETVLEGQFTRHILINVSVNGVYVDYFLLDRDPVLVDGGVAVQFENIAESHFDDIIVEQG